MRKQTGKQWYMAIKIDLEKAYDRLRWDFLDQTLNLIGIPFKLQRAIMLCVITASFWVLCNGKLSEEVVPSRGVRQVCPLSPYLFVLCIE